MPCTVDRRDVEDQVASERDTVVNLLCCACTELERHGLICGMPAALVAWWGSHQAADRVKTSEAEATASRKRRADEARAKLTPDELEALGIRRDRL